MKAAAAALGLAIPPDCEAGVEANLALLDRYASLLHDFALPDPCEPAPEYRP